MTESFAADVLARGGLTALIVVALLWAGWRIVTAATAKAWETVAKFFTQLIGSIQSLTDEVKHLGDKSATQHAQLTSELSDMSNRITRIEARGDERERWGEVTPVCDITDPNGRKKRT